MKPQSDVQSKQNKTNKHRDQKEDHQFRDTTSVPTIPRHHECLNHFIRRSFHSHPGHTQQTNHLPMRNFRKSFGEHIRRVVCRCDIRKIDQTELLKIPGGMEADVYVFSARFLCLLHG
jgi:hypothetical protein